MALDQFDHEILNIVSRNNLFTHAEIGEMICLSASSVRRRLIALRKSGIISQDVSIVDTNIMGLTFLVHIWTKINSPKQDQQFKNFIDADSAISQCYSVSGDMDYVLIAHAASAQDYEKWSEQLFLSNPLVDRYTSILVWSRSKFSMKIAPFSEN